MKLKWVAFCLAPSFPDVGLVCRQLWEKKEEQVVSYEFQDLLIAHDQGSRFCLVF